MRKRRRLSVLWAAAIVLLTVLVCSGIAGAITYGELDNDDHPYVGMVLFHNEDGAWYCSGTLLSTTVFLTAGHCTDGADSAKVYFDSRITSSSPYVEGTPITHPRFEWGRSAQTNFSDVGVVVFKDDEAVEMNTYGQLPPLNFLDDLATASAQQELTFTVVGYGLQDVRPRVQDDLVRYKGTASFINLRSAINDGHNIQTTNTPSRRSSGGTCSGDSGGPLLYDDTNIVVGINSFGFSPSANCDGPDFFYRTDIANTQDFVNDFLVP